MSKHSARDVIDSIRSCYLFEEMSDEVVERLASICQVETVSKRHSIFEAGDEPDGLRIVIEGLIRVWINDEDGQELTITLVEPGDALGEISLLDGQLRSANASAIEKSKVVFLSRSAFEQVLDENPAFARQLIILLCEMLRRNTSDLSGFAFDDLQVRLSRKIHELAFAHATIADGKASFERTFSQTELANMLGATREAINKRLAIMSQMKLISIEKGRITVPRLDLLVETVL